MRWDLWLALMAAVDEDKEYSRLMQIAKSVTGRTSVVWITGSLTGNDLSRAGLRALNALADRGASVYAVNAASCIALTQVGAKTGSLLPLTGP